MGGATVSGSRLVARERLFTRLDKALGPGSVWLSGGAGAGKTALVESYLDARDRAHLHFRLDVDDGDPYRLILRLDAATAGIENASSTAPLAGVTAGPLADIAVPEPFVAGRRAFGRLFDAATTPRVLVFDDLERLPSGCATERLLVDALAALPAGWSIVLIGRSEAPACFARARATATLATIEGKELRLTADEAAALVTRHARRPLASDALARLVDLADGWAALAVLLANTESTGQPDRPGAPVDADVPEVVFDYFAEDVLGTLDPVLQMQLETLALVPSPDANLAARLSGDDDAVSRLDTLAARHFFVERLPGLLVGKTVSPPTYRLHALFRAFLVRRLGRRLGETGLRSEAMRLAGLLDELGQTESALTLLLEYRAYDQAVVTMERLAPTLIREQRHLTVARWMQALPPERVRASGTLSLWCGAANLFVDTPSAREHLERAWQACHAEPSPEAVLACCIAIDTWLAHWDDFHGMDVWIERLGARLAADGLPAEPDLAGHVTSSMLHGSMFRGQDPELIADWHARGLERLDHRVSGTVYMMLAQALVLVPLWTRSLSLAEMVLQRVHAAVFADVTVEPLIELWYRTLEAPVRWAQADRAATEHACARGLACARESGADFSNVLLPYHAGIACLNAGDGDAAASYADRVADATGTRTDRLMDLTCHHQLAGRLAWHRDRHALAAEHLRKAADRASKAGLGFAAAMQHVGLAFLAADRGDRPMAERSLAATRAEIGSLQLSILELDIAMCEAWLARQDDEPALDKLRHAFAIARRDARVASCWWSRPMLAELCAMALDADIEISHVTRIVRLHALDAPPRYRHLLAWPWQVRLHLMGRVRTVIEDEQLASDGARGARPLELVHAVAVLGGQAKASVLADLLWPDAEGDAAMDSFKTTLSRARRRLGVAGALPLVDGQLSLDPDLVWCDVVALTALDRETALVDIDPDARRHADEAIIDLYAGELLPDETRRWASEARRRVRDRWLRAVMRRGEAFALASRHDRAAAVYERALELAPDVEALYRCAMTAHLLAGTAEAGLLLYEQSRLALFHSPDRTPDEATESIRETLRKAVRAF